MTERAATANALFARWVNIRSDLVCQIEHLMGALGPAVTGSPEPKILTAEERAEWVEAAQRLSETMEARLSALMTDTANHIHS